MEEVMGRTDVMYYFRSLRRKSLDSIYVKLVKSIIMKKLNLLTGILLAISNLAFAQNELNPIKHGQYWEQGYGMPDYNFTNNECATDIQKTSTGLVFTGYSGNESDGHNMAFWRLDDIGALVQFGSYGDNNHDQIGSAIIPDPNGGFCIVGRETDFHTYNHQNMHSTIADGDQVLIKYINDLGVELSSTKLGHIDTPQVAVDVINDGSGNFVVLANRRYSEFDTQDMRVIKISPSGNIIWDKIHRISNTNIFGQKIVADGNGNYVILTNDIDNGIPILYKISSAGVYETHYDYPQANPTICYGIAANTTGYHLAGETDNGTDVDGYILNIGLDFTEGTDISETNPTTGNEGFKDIVAQPNGYLATGSCDNLGEGMSDVWLVHYDNSFNTELVETLGGEEDDYGYSAVVVPEVFSVFVGGFNSSYGIQESGNAYLGGVKVNMGLPESSEECKVPRVLFVDDFVKIISPQSGIIDSTVGILGKSNLETDVINFAVDNKIGILELYGVDHIFRNANNNALGNHYRKLLNSFSASCKRKGIYCSMISGYKELPYDEAREFNKHVQASQYGYNYEGKLDYYMLEHEFWNARKTTSSKNSNVDNSTGGQDTIILPSGTDFNDHYLDCYQDHKNILNQLSAKKYNDANIWEIHDYFGFFYNYTWDFPANNYNRNNTTWRDSIAGELEGMSDGMFLAYYEPYKYDSGTVFLGGNQNNGFVQLWQERISYLGQSSVDTTKIFPLFSAEYYDTPSGQFCGEGTGTDFLGKYLEGPPANQGAIGNNFKKVEKIYLDQHDSIYNQTTAFPNIRNIQVNATSWFTYKCVKDKNFGDKTRKPCYAFTRNPLEINEIDRNQTQRFLVYPNPTNHNLNLSFEHEINGLIQLVDMQGKLLLESKISDNSVQINVATFSNGIYYLMVKTPTEVISQKVIISK
jgi:hypothetical protein